VVLHYIFIKMKKLIRNIKRNYFLFRLREVENWQKATEAGQLSGWDNYCSPAEFSEYQRTFDDVKKENIDKWIRKIVQT